MEKATLYRVDQPQHRTTYQTAYDPRMAKSMHLTEIYRSITGKRALKAYSKLEVRPATKEEAEAYARKLIEG